MAQPDLALGSRHRDVHESELFCVFVLAAAFFKRGKARRCDPSDLCQGLVQDCRPVDGCRSAVRGGFAWAGGPRSGRITVSNSRPFDLWIVINRTALLCVSASGDSSASSLWRASCSSRAKHAARSCPPRAAQASMRVTRSCTFGESLRAVVAGGFDLGERACAQSVGKRKRCRELACFVDECTESLARGGRAAARRRGPAFRSEGVPVDRLSRQSR